MILFDLPYFDRLCETIKSNQGRTFSISNVEDREKFIKHLKGYESSRVGKMPEVSFNDDYTKIKIFKIEE